ncbi:helix-turn-helix Fis-type [Turneriella parva DSM 21527]|uniref:Helix-turn-helix Fis-type n=2 Tax=Turneriella TaxID=338321 RepID=I4B0N3_TURPD|nr:helix-turn-helix Fis-type [Turneriella parva DSM 21527]
MRIFMEYKTDILPVVERGRIVGQIDRLSLIEALSEIKAEGAYLAMQPAETSEELLRRLDESGGDGLATVNRQFEFNALWGRAEILQAQGKIPQVKIWTPPAPQVDSEPQAVPSPPTTLPRGEGRANIPFSSQVTEASPSSEREKEGDVSTFTIVREAPPKFAKPAPTAAEATRAVSENLHREIERGRLAINTLAALDLPLMACDGNGNEMFHNRAFAEIRLRDAMHLSSADLIQRAKDAITESAMKGELDIERAVVLKAGPRGYRVSCKAIRDYDNPAARAVGYIFWLVATSPPTPLSLRRGGGAVEDGGGGEVNYAGKTLPEILQAEEARVLAWAMQEANGNQSDAALLLNIPRQTFNYRYRKLMRAKEPRVRGSERKQP